MSFKIIACISSNAGIGKNNGELLFCIKEDMKMFKHLTVGDSEGNIIIFGRKTFDSVIKMNNGKLLSSRINVVLTRDKKYKSKYGELVYNSVECIINHHKTTKDKDKKVYVCGGSEIYKLFLPYVDEIFLTIVNKHVEEAEAFYPIKLQEHLGFVMTDESERYYAEEYDAYYKFVKYTKSDNVN